MTAAAMPTASTVIAYPLYPFRRNAKAAITQAPTTAIQDARARFMTTMFQQMADGHVASADLTPEGAVEHLVESSPDLRAAAILDSSGELVAATGPNDWSERGREIWDAAGWRGDDPAQIHIATEAGEVFALRAADGTSVIALANRFALASLMFCDLRAALRRLEAEYAGSVDT